MNAWPDVKTIGGYIPVSYQLLDDWHVVEPEYGPPLPASIEMRRRLGGHPVGQYRRAS